LFGDSDIISNVASGADNGGNINLTADSILAFDDSDILAFARDGRGGDIILNTRVFFGENYRPAPKGTDPNTLENNNQVDVNASGAVNGVITTPDVSFIQNSLTELPENQIDTDSLLANSCIVRRNQPPQGSFTITGTGGFPQRPGDAQMSTFPTVDIETLPNDSTPTNTNPNRPWQKGDPIVEPQGVYRLPNGKTRYESRMFLIVLFYHSRLKSQISLFSSLLGCTFVQWKVHSCAITLTSLCH
jgi:large exoprotein involved in heme utilization and adhesion